MGDIVLPEVLQGFRSRRDFELASRPLRPLTIIDVAGRDIAIQAALNFRALRARGIAVRKIIDTLIATRCIADDHILHSDRDFDPFVEHLGLRSLLDPG